MLWPEKSSSGILAEGPMAIEPIALSSILGAPVYDSSGILAGRVREVAISPQYDSSRISDLVVKTQDGDRLDQQIIDVHGRKVVRVNDVDLRTEPGNGALNIRVGQVDVGLRGAIRRLLKGLAPSSAVEALVSRMPERAIPWEAVNLIETDPARRVHLKLEYGRLSRLHPADIADILEDLAPAEREAVFESLGD